MATNAPTPLRQVLEERVRQLVLDTESLFAEARDRARRDMADQLNQAARRLRQTASLEELEATLVDATAAFCPAAALFFVNGEMAVGQGIRGVAESAARDFAALELPLDAAPALAGAVHSRDPVVAAATPGEVSERLAKLLEHAPAGRVSIYPLVARDRVAALLYVWGTVQGPAIELLAQTAALVWAALAEPARAPASELVAIETAGPSNAALAGHRPAASWDELSPDEQRVHLRAQRYARVQVSEMRLFEPDAVQSGRAERNLYGALRRQIDGARESFRSSFFPTCPSMLDYLHLELVRTLANENPELLGSDYPGPLV